jgi:hypothetical protein
VLLYVNGSYLAGHLLASSPIAHFYPKPPTYPVSPYL